MKCSARGCTKDARMAILTSRPTRDDLYSKVFYDDRDPMVPKKAQRYCKKCGIETITELSNTLVHSDD